MELVNWLYSLLGKNLTSWYYYCRWVIKDEKTFSYLKKIILLVGNERNIIDNLKCLVWGLERYSRNQLKQRLFVLVAIPVP